MNFGIWNTSILPETAASANPLAGSCPFDSSDVGWSPCLLGQHDLNAQSWKVILTFEVFLFADIKENKISGLPERRAKILRGRGLGR